MLTMRTYLPTFLITFFMSAALWRFHMPILANSVELACAKWKVPCPFRQPEWEKLYHFNEILHPCPQITRLTDWCLMHDDGAEAGNAISSLGTARLQPLDTTTTGNLARGLLYNHSTEMGCANGTLSRFIKVINDASSGTLCHATFQNKTCDVVVRRRRMKHFDRTTSCCNRKYSKLAILKRNFILAGVAFIFAVACTISAMLMNCRRAGARNARQHFGSPYVALIEYIVVVDCGRVQEKYDDEEQVLGYNAAAGGVRMIQGNLPPTPPPSPIV